MIHKIMLWIGTALFKNRNQNAYLSKAGVKTIAFALITRAFLAHSATVDTFEQWCESPASGAALASREILLDSLGAAHNCILAKERMLSVKVLPLSNKHISDISGLQFAKSVWYLDLSHNEISDVDSLKSLDNLKYLNLNFNQVSDIAPLRQLKHLTTLYLNTNKVGYVGALSELLNLKLLDLSNNQIESLAEIWDLPQLQYVKADNNKIETLGKCNWITPQLESISLMENKIKSLRVLSTAMELKSLEASQNLLESIDIDQDLPKLTVANFYKNNVSDISGIRFFKNIESLGLSSNAIEILSNDLPKFQTLKYLNVSDNKLIDVSILSHWPSLKVINMDKNQVTSIHGLSGFSPDKIFARQNPVERVCPFSTSVCVWE